MSAPEITVLVDVDPAFLPRVEQTLVERAVREALRAGAPDLAARERACYEVSVRVSDDDEMRQLNRDYRDVDKPTDVLSFSFEDPSEAPEIDFPPDMPRQLGAIAVSYPYVERQAADLGHSEQKELAWLIIHGALQLLGYRHATDEEAERMESLEQVALGALGFSAS